MWCWKILIIIHIIFIYSYSYNISNTCKYLHSITNGMVLKDNCIASKYTTGGYQTGTIQYNYQGYFRAYFDSTNGNLMIFTLNELENNNKKYVNKMPPINVPGSAFAKYPFFNSTKKYNLPKFANSLLRVSTKGIEIISAATNKTLWKGNNSSCLIPRLIMQYDRNLILCCNIDKSGNPINPQWSSNTACNIKPSYWCSNNGRR